MRNLIICSLICIICGTGCIITRVHTMPVQKYSAPYDLVWGSTLKYLDREKEPIVVSDKEKGMISTDWVNMHKPFGVKRYRYDIQIANLGEDNVQVGIASPQEAYSMGDWEEILPHERRARRMFGFIRREVKRALRVTKAEERPFNKRQIGLIKEE